MSLKIVWPTRSRTGSQFLLKLTTALTGAALIDPQARVNGARQNFSEKEEVNTFKKMFLEGRGLTYLREHNIVSMKYEDPGKDDFILDVHREFPNAVFLASYRKIEDVISSHYNIEKWGHHESDVLYQFSACLRLYEELAKDNRFFMLNIDEPGQFSLDCMADKIGVAVTSKARSLVEEWQPINDLKYQVEKDRVFTGRKEPPRMDILRKIHPWIDKTEQKYLELWRRTST